jgi:hypothetical protein
LSAEALYRIIGLDRTLLNIRPLRARIVLFDDVLTTGKHYKWLMPRNLALQPFKTVSYATRGRAIPRLRDHLGDQLPLFEATPRACWISPADGSPLCCRGAAARKPRPRRESRRHNRAFDAELIFRSALAGAVTPSGA